MIALILSFIFCFAITSSLSFVVINQYKSDKIFEMKRKEIIEPFSVSKYYERMEKVTNDILKEKETMKYTIILWLGLDGLLLNEDGTSEWIRRDAYKNHNFEGTDERVKHERSLFEALHIPVIIGDRDAKKDAFEAAHIIDDCKAHISREDDAPKLRDDRDKMEASNLHINYPSYISFCGSQIQEVINPVHTEMERS